MKSEARDHLAGGDEQEKRLAWWAAFEIHELLHGSLIQRAAKSIDSLGRVCEYLPGGEMGEGSIDGSLDFSRRPERHDHRLGLHSRKILSASASAKSFSSVIFSALSLPRTTTTDNPMCSQSAESSVATRSASRASRWARSMTLRGKACGVCALQSPNRSTVTTTLPLESTRLSVSATGNAAMAPFPCLLYTSDAADE